MSSRVKRKEDKIYMKTMRDFIIVCPDCGETMVIKRESITGLYDRRVDIDAVCTNNHCNHVETVYMEDSFHNHIITFKDTLEIICENCDSTEIEVIDSPANGQFLVCLHCDSKERLG